MNTQSLVARQNQRKRSLPFADVKRSWANFFADLSLFASLQIARLMVWRALRRRRTLSEAKVLEK
jgi:hypothetical protein